MKKPTVTYIQKYDFSVNPVKKWKSIIWVNLRDTLIVLSIIALFIFK